MTDHSAIDATPPSLVSKGKIALIAGYLLISVAAGAVMIWPGLPAYINWVVGGGLLILFLALVRRFTVWVASLDELLQLIALRAMATAGLLAVWFILAVGFLFARFGPDNLWLIVAIGPPQYWVFAIVFMVVLERQHLEG